MLFDLRRRGDAKLSSGARPLPSDFLDWQVALRRWTAEVRNGSPHVGVAPLLIVRRSRGAPGVTAHSIICGLLPREEELDTKTRQFRELYDTGHPDGARAIYDLGIEYLKGYYESAADFDPLSVTTLLPEDAPVVVALRADPRCALVFHVFELEDTSEVSRLRCLQLNCSAEIHDSGSVYENVLWHNALFHGLVNEHVVLRFRHHQTFDTRFGGLEELR
jgi:hypothetical protein